MSAIGQYDYIREVIASHGSDSPQAARVPVEYIDYVG
jgi:hypothetical protein